MTFIWQKSVPSMFTCSEGSPLVTLIIFSFAQYYDNINVQQLPSPQGNFVVLILMCSYAMNSGCCTPRLPSPSRFGTASRYRRRWMKAPWTERWRSTSWKNGSHLSSSIQDLHFLSIFSSHGKSSLFTTSNSQGMNIVAVARALSVFL